MWGPRGLPGGVKGQPTVEPRPAAQHPSLGVELAGQCPQGAEGTPLWPSRALGCPMAYASRARGRPAAARRALSYLGCLRPAPRSVPPRRHRRDPPPRRAQFHFHQTGGRVGAAGFLHAVVPRVRSGATSSARGRHDRDRSGVVLFFFTTRPSCTSRSRCPSRTSGSTAGRCSCCICG